mmetsp:Transcript_4074/g.8742  ORF Transcript_4074/g.8742 Transcript_4074/m.8742 type:complete len:521 (+) Transcript_4074:395-1957(+)
MGFALLRGVSGHAQPQRLLPSEVHNPPTDIRSFDIRLRGPASQLPSTRARERRASCGPLLPKREPQCCSNTPEAFGSCSWPQVNRRTRRHQRLDRCQPVGALAPHDIICGWCRRHLGGLPLPPLGAQVCEHSRPYRFDSGSCVHDHQRSEHASCKPGWRRVRCHALHHGFPLSRLWCLLLGPRHVQVGAAHSLHRPRCKGGGGRREEVPCAPPRPVARRLCRQPVGAHERHGLPRRGLRPLPDDAAVVVGPGHHQSSSLRRGLCHGLGAVLGRGGGALPLPRHHLRRLRAVVLREGRREVEDSGRALEPEGRLGDFVRQHLPRFLLGGLHPRRRGRRKADRVGCQKEREPSAAVPGGGGAVRAGMHRGHPGVLQRVGLCAVRHPRRGLLPGRQDHVLDLHARQCPLHHELMARWQRGVVGSSLLRRRRWASRRTRRPRQRLRDRRAGGPRHRFCLCLCFWSRGDVRDIQRHQDDSHLLGRVASDLARKGGCGRGGVGGGLRAPTPLGLIRWRLDEQPPRR